MPSDRFNAAVELAQFFHETYERLAPAYGYKTREASAVPWAEVPENLKHLMIAVSHEVLKAEMLARVGRPTKDDQGPTAMLVTSSESHVRIDLGAECTWFALEKAGAINFAVTILQHCGVGVNVQLVAAPDPGQAPPA